MLNTMKLNDGTAVLDRTDNDGFALLNPYRYTNRAQAQKKADALRAKGYAARVYQPRLGPVFYISFE